MEIIELVTINRKLEAQIQALSKRCNGYEPYYITAHAKDTDLSHIAHYAAFEDRSYTHLIGFLSFLITDKQAELTAMVDPSYRRNRVFSCLYVYAKEYVDAFAVQEIVCAIPDYLTSTSFNKGISFTEYLLRLDGKNVVDSTCPELTQYECCFLDDYTAYLMYDLSNEDENSEPIAVCNLDFQNSFTNLYDVFVDAPLRGKGLGTELMQNLIYDYFNEFSNPLVLNVRSTNTAAYSLYKKCGFTEVSHIHYYKV
jgi:GNAT superfamily N-acetyltransferase